MTTASSTKIAHWGRWVLISLAILLLYLGLNTPSHWTAWTPAIALYGSILAFIYHLTLRPGIGWALSQAKQQERLQLTLGLSIIRMPLFALLLVMGPLQLDKPNLVPLTGTGLSCFMATWLLLWLFQDKRPKASE